MRTDLSRIVAVVVLALGAGSCNDGDSLNPGDEEIAPLTATALDRQSIQLRWTAVAKASGYVLERRADLKGDFEPILERSSLTQTNYVDRGLVANTIYGYRLRALDDFGATLGISPVAGARTAPEPGIEVTVLSNLGGDQRFSVDSNGYQARVRMGTFDQFLPIDAVSTGPVVELFQPLDGGVYQVTLEDLSSNCSARGQQVHPVTVTAAGLNTIAKTEFVVDCRDRTRGRVTAVVRADGDSSDADGFKVALSGLAGDQTLPDSLRAVVIRRDAAATGDSVVFDNIRPGRYSLTIENVAPFCTVAPPAQRDSLTVEPLADLSQTFDVTCTGNGGDTGSGPYTFRAAWSPDTAPTGSVVRLSTTFDLGANPTVDFGGYQFDVVTTGGVVRLDSIVSRAPGFQATVAVKESGQRGTALGALVPVGITSGVVPVADFFYTVTGTTGRSIRPLLDQPTFGRGNGNDLTSQTRRVTGTFTVGTKIGSGANQPPIAQANGPYTGTAGTPISFTAAGSSDPDGSISSYSWDFGDGQTGTGASPTHAYGAAGSYTARVTVTDDDGATASAQASVTVGPGGPATKPFTWRSAFGTVNPADKNVSLTVTLDLSADIPETAGQEALQRFVLDSLKWDPTVLRYLSFSFSSGTGSLGFITAASGKIRFSGTIDAAKSKGVIPIGVVRFEVIGGGGTATTTKTSLGSLAGTAGTGSYNYVPRTEIAEGTLTVSGGGSAGTTVSGTVTSTQSAPLANVTVTLSASGGSATTNASGGYTIANVTAGSYTASLSALPSGCTAPAPANVTVATTPVAGVNFSVTCTPQGGTATVIGTVTRTGTGAGPLPGATVQVSGAGSAVTAANGTYSIANVPSGSRTVSVASAGLPAGCTAPAAKTVTVPASGSATADFAVACAAPSKGTVKGQIVFASGSGTPSLAGAVVTVTPTNGSAPPGVAPDALGNYTVGGVDVANPAGTVKVTSLPSGCTPPTPQVNYSGLTAGGTVTAPTITINCPATTNNYKFTIAFSAISGGKTTMTAKIDMSTRNDPNNNGNGADKIGGFSGQILYPTSRLSAPSCAGVSLAGVIGTGMAGQLVPVLSNVPAGASGNDITIFTCTFTVTGTGPSPIQLNAPGFGDPTGSVDFTAFVDIILGDIP